jgi:hypothetical protein
MTITVCILIGFIVLCFVISLYITERNYYKERGDLLNRLMARDYKEYAVFDAHKEEVKKVKEPKNIFNAQDAFPVD